MTQYLLTATRGTATISEIIYAATDREATAKCVGPLMRLAFDPSQPERAPGEITLRNEAGTIIYHVEEEM
jgi:hypothetical protein